MMIGSAIGGMNIATTIEGRERYPVNVRYQRHYRTDMLLYLDHAYDRFRREGRMRNLEDLKEAVEFEAVKRIRPKKMTVMAVLMGLLPIMWSQGAGADVMMKRIAAPMVGGVVTSFILKLLIYPVIFTLWRWHWEVKPGLVESNPGLDRQRSRAPRATLLEVSSLEDG